MTSSNLFLSWKIQRTLRGKERRGCGRRGREVPKEAPLSVGRLMSEMTECERKSSFSEGSREPRCELRSEGSKNVRSQPQIRHSSSARRSNILEIALLARTPMTVPFRHPIGFIKKYFYTG